MQKAVLLLAALVACVAVIDALPRDRFRYRPVARYQRIPRYNPRHAQYRRTSPARLVEEDEEPLEPELPTTVLDDELPAADLPEEDSFPAEDPALLEPAPVPGEDEESRSANPDESVDQLPEPELRGSDLSEGYFPLRFNGDLFGAAVAIANSYSTGKGGVSQSRAIAIGSPDDAKYSRRY